jgi:cobyrinic acid a,c-diamide synthase
VGGFINTRAAGEDHGGGVSSAIGKATGLPVLGFLPREEALRVPERHLGLVPTREPGRWLEFTQAAADSVARHLDLDRLLAIARQAPPLPGPDEAQTERAGGFIPPGSSSPTVRWGLATPVIAVARDEAFHFTYQDNLDLLQAAGAEIAFFSTLRDEALPAGTSGVILSGGFPEVYAEGLAANRSLHTALRAAHRQGLPIYAECGGLMYLTQAIVAGDRRRHPMVGLLPGQCVMSNRLMLGYRLARSASGSWFLGEGETVRGHEFHYSVWEGRPDNLPPAYWLLPRSGQGPARPEGARVGKLWASYVHVHLGTKPELAGRFVEACRGSPGGQS